MTVAAILGHKGRDVETTAPGVTLVEAATKLAKRKIGALVVVEETDGIAGILSERDIVRAIAASGAGALGQTVDTVMTRKVVTCSDAETINEVMTRMTKGKFRHLPVADDDGRLAGIISIGDVVKARIEQVEREAEELRSYIHTA